MRKKIVAGNWKMNCNLEETKSLLEEIKTESSTLNNDVQLIVSPSFTNISTAVESLKNTNIKVAAQNVHPEEKGAFTGEISVDMLASVGVKTVILGHSERRKYFGETKPILNKKVNTALRHEFDVIFCVGESLEEREKNNHFKVIEEQLDKSLFYIKKETWSKMIIAYEPVWAIGTGKTASAAQAQEMHSFIRELIAQKYDQKTADELSILYGGSVKPENSAEIFAQKDVDGGLIGGAALNAKSFIAIANSF